MVKAPNRRDQFDSNVWVNPVYQAPAGYQSAAVVRPNPTPADSGTPNDLGPATLIHADTCGGHGATRPTWYCIRCGKLWPCENAIAALRKHPNLLMMYKLMGRVVYMAWLDLAPADTDLHWRRFLGWLRS